MYRLLSEAIEANRIVHLQLSDKTVHTIVPEELRTRGKHDVLHCTELARMESRVIKLSDIVAAEYAESPVETTSARVA